LRQRRAAGFRARGGQRSLEIRAKADREVTVLIAQATAASEQLRGDGDAARNHIYAAAYEREGIKRGLTKPPISQRFS
jgi:membrane protease subunit HflC